MTHFFILVAKVIYYDVSVRIHPFLVSTILIKNQTKGKKRKNRTQRQERDGYCPSLSVPSLSPDPYGTSFRPVTRTTSHPTTKVCTNKGDVLRSVVSPLPYPSFFGSFLTQI